MLPILIVEDDPTQRDVLYDLFSEDFPCEAVESVEDALRKLDARPYGVVLTDISMPGKSGLELLGHIKQTLPETQVILFSGIDDEQYSHGLSKMGAFDYLTKPFTVDEIAHSVARALTEHARLRAETPVEEGDVDKSHEGPCAVDNAPVFACVQLGGIFSLAEILDIVQRGRMSGYVELHWDNETIKRARASGKFEDAAGALDEAVLSTVGWLYLKDGLIIDAVLDEAEGSPYWRDAEQSLAVLVKLATYVGSGVRAWGFAMGKVNRPAKLSVRDNSAKLFSIITEDEAREGGESLPNFDDAMLDPAISPASRLAA